MDAEMKTYQDTASCGNATSRELWLQGIDEVISPGRLHG